MCLLRANWRMAVLCVIAMHAGGAAGIAAPPPLLELTAGEQKYRGKVVAYDDSVCWLLDRDGALHPLETGKVSSWKQAAPRFSGRSSSEVSAQLRKELGPEFDVAGTEHYQVCAAPKQAAEYAQVLEGIYRSFRNYFSVRGFHLAEPEFPLVAIVFPDQAGFARYCRRDKVQAFARLLGYYHPGSNRVAMFADRGHRVSWRDALPPGAHIDGWLGLLNDPEITFPPAIHSGWHGSISAGLRETLIHEATHQVAFNTGLHSRIGSNPRWVVEGLATVFEPDGIRDTTPHQPVASRINRERFLGFGNYRKTRRPTNSLAAFLRSDDPFQREMLDAYSQAWALTFYLVETRSGDYARYLRRIASRPPLEDYSPEARLADFCASFGKDLPWLEADFLRFMERL